MPDTALRVRGLRGSDGPEVGRIERLRSGSRGAARPGRNGARRKPGAGARVELAAEADDGSLAGYLLGEVRAFEFGSEACGWILALAVDPARERAGTATALLEEACVRFRRAGVRRVRTMVRRNDVPFLSFFRARGFVGGPFVQLERGTEAPE